MFSEEGSPRTPSPVVRATVGNPRGLLSAYQGAEQEGIDGSTGAPKGFVPWPRLSDYLRKISCRVHRRGGLFDACESTSCGLESAVYTEGPGMQHQSSDPGRSAKIFRRHPRPPAQACPRLERRRSVSLDRPKGQATFAGGQTISSDQDEAGETLAPVHPSSKEDSSEANRSWFRAVARRGDSLS